MVEMFNSEYEVINEINSRLYFPTSEFSFQIQTQIQQTDLSNLNMQNIWHKFLEIVLIFYCVF